MYLLNNSYLVRSRAAGITAGTNHQCGSGVHIRCGVRGGPHATMYPPAPLQSSPVPPQFHIHSHRGNYAPMST